jgi:hypothetical protein
VLFRSLASFFFLVSVQGEFESLLRDERPLEAWANWLNTVLDGILGEVGYH